MLSEEQSAAFVWFNMLSPNASLAEIQAFMTVVAHCRLSLSSIVDYNKRFGFTSKSLQYYSTHRDENDRTAFWINEPDHASRPGVFRIPYTSFVDIDEMGIYETAASRTRGRSFVGVPARMSGRPRRSGQQWTLLVAVDARVGVIARMLYHRGTSKEIFEFFVRFFVFPKIALTGSRVFTYDNLAAHLAIGVKNAIFYEGHTLVLRPIHSPDFGGVEWVFAYVRKFLQHYDSLVTRDNLLSAINTCLDIVTPELVAKFMAAAHFYVPPYPFTPYLGQQ